MAALAAIVANNIFVAHPIGVAPYLSVVVFCKGVTEALL